LSVPISGNDYAVVVIFLLRKAKNVVVNTPSAIM